MTTINTSGVYMTLSINILSGSYRENSNSRRFALFLKNILLSQGVSVTWVDAKTYDLPFLKETYADALKNKSSNLETLEKLHTLFNSCDAFILLSAEYNHLPVPGLLNMLNFFYTEYHNKPSGLATYSVGSYGGARIEPALRTIADTLGMPSIAPILSCAHVHKLLSPEGQLQETADITDSVRRAFTKNTDLFIKTLLHHANIFRQLRT